VVDDASGVNFIKKNFWILEKQIGWVIFKFPTKPSFPSCGLTVGED